MIFDMTGTGGVQIHFTFSDKEPDHPIWEHAIKMVDYKAELGDLYYFPVLGEHGDLLIGLGVESELTINDLRLVFYKVGKLLRDKGEDEIELHIPKLNGMCSRRIAEAVTEGMMQSAYRFDLSKKQKTTKEITVHYYGTPGKEHRAEAGLEDAKNFMAGIDLARDLVNNRSNIIYPKTLAERAVNELEPLGITVHVFKEKDIAELGMEAFMSVARGSSRKPRLIVMEYNGDPDTKFKTALVGKGLTYDSGGYSIKPTGSMLTMYSDMAGAATVIGTMKTLALRNAKSNVVGLIAACENMISGTAYKPGDIIGSLSGKTIEIVNTDAEGRLTLADAVNFVTGTMKCDRVIDLATLTGACLVALGESYTGIVTNNKEFLAELQAAADEAGERIWELPNDKDFAKMNKSKVADLRNSGGRLGGTISAGLFVGEFVENDTPWIHMDIAGTAYLSKTNGYLQPGATGVHVKTLAHLLHNQEL